MNIHRTESHTHVTHRVTLQPAREGKVGLLRTSRFCLILKNCLKRRIGPRGKRGLEAAGQARLRH